MDTQPEVIIPHDDRKPDQPQQPVTNASTVASTTQPGPDMQQAPASAVVAPDLQAQEQPAYTGAVTPIASPSLGAEAAPQDPTADWQYNQTSDPTMNDPQGLPEDLNWAASEFIEHPKGAGWYGLLLLAALVFAALDYFVTKDIVSTSVIIIAAVLFGVYAGHKPRTQQYHLSPRGLEIGGKLYAFKAFKAFSIVEEASSSSIVFAPLGRFAPPLTIYVSTDMEERVLDYISLFLPFEAHRADMVDGLLRRIRF